MAWELNFYSNFTIINAANFAIISHTGNSYTIASMANDNIPPNASVTLQFNGEGQNPILYNFSLTEIAISQ
jgi:hypothetical protein